MAHHLKNAVECARCAFKVDCGGISEKPSIWGCYSECILKCNPDICDLTCPNNQHLFAARLNEIAGTFSYTGPALAVPTRQLPLYVPKIHNGSGRLEPLHIQMAAIPVRACIRKSGLNISGRFETPDDVRNYFCLSHQTSYIISCISVDDEVELVWNGIKYHGLAGELAKLKSVAIIVPNFSFFIDDVPRIHTLYNRKRICMAASILSEAGCRVILPFNATTSNDWDFWYNFLVENSSMVYVAKEFQTGLSEQTAAIQAIDQLAQLQERLGRPLHPIAFGGSRYTDNFGKHFDKYTIVESRAFMLATNRRRAILTKSGLYSEEFSPTSPNETIDKLLRDNIKARRDRHKFRSI